MLGSDQGRASCTGWGGKTSESIYLLMAFTEDRVYHSTPAGCCTRRDHFSYDNLIELVGGHDDNNAAAAANEYQFDHVQHINNASSTTSTTTTTTHDIPHHYLLIINLISVKLDTTTTIEHDIGRWTFFRPSYAPE